MVVICIDQTSVLEKKHQIHSMQQIYSPVTKVAVWLGRPDTDAAMTELLESDKLSVRTVALGVVAAHPYWKRVWIVQELVSA